MRKFFGVILIILGSALLLLWFVLLSMIIKEGNSLSVPGMILPLVASAFLILGIIMVNPQNEQARYLKAQKKKQKRLERSEKNYKDYQSGNSSENVDFYADTKDNNKDMFLYHVERFFTAKQEKSFSEILHTWMPFMYIVGLAIMIIMLVQEHDDFILTIALVIFFSCLVIAIVGSQSAFRVNVRAKLYGFILAEKVDMNKQCPIGKALFLVKNTSNLAEEVHGIVIAPRQLRRKIMEQDKQKEGMINDIHATMQTEEFKLSVEREINHPNNSLEGWYITPMFGVKTGLTGIFGTKLSFTERRGTKNSCMLYRDITEYKEIKQIIRNMYRTK